jgi:hypothetical protein
MGWGGLVTAAWKKRGGLLACLAVGAARVVHSPAGRAAVARDAVHMLAAQPGGDAAMSAYAGWPTARRLL